MAEDKELQRGLSLPMAVFIIIGMVIGSSIWVSPAAYLSRTGPAVFLAYLIAVIPAVFVAFIAAYIGSAIPVAGGSYVVNSRLTGGLAGFLTVWLILLAVGSALATLAAVLGLFLSELFLIPENMVMIFVIVVGIAVLVIFYLINFLQVKISGAVEMIITLFGDVLVMIIFIIAAIPFYNPNNLDPIIPPQLGLSPLLFASLVFFFSYVGFTLILDVAGEVKNPKKNIPLALLISIPLLVGLYTFQSLMVAAIHPWNEPVGTVTEILTKGRILPQGAIILVTILIVVAIASTIHPVYLAYSRDILMAGRDGLFSDKFTKVHKKYKTPIPALTLLLVIGIIFILIFIPLLTPEYGIATAAVLLSAFTGVAALLIQIPLCIAAIKLPKKFPNLHKSSGFKPSIKTIKIMGMIGAIVSAVFVLLLFFDPDAGLIIALVVLPYTLIGAIVYYIRKRSLAKKGINIKDVLKKFPEEIVFEEEMPSKIERLTEEG
ncbi:MAG: amino acid permease [Candidatus Lokiarchaeota archaeon]|nr:amino acid permease [Candidatus Lokiarchaeota archaeon]MBD3341013.1 amino acid permease [Candidatus Lokiarchaeota archaeon]